MVYLALNEIFYALTFIHHMKKLTQNYFFY